MLPSRFTSPTKRTKFRAMSLLPIITLPDPKLREISSSVEDVTDDIRSLADDMLETMYDAPGIGLAAVQVGVLKRVIVVDAANNDDDTEQRHPLILINPEIVSRSEATRDYEEGCLSLPDVRIDVERPCEITVRYISREGAARELTADGLLATVIQHEVDHLDGKLIIDFMSRLKRDMVIKRFKKAARSA